MARAPKQFVCHDKKLSEKPLILKLFEGHQKPHDDEIGCL